jgi:spoIIIJ-associated protein
LGATDVSDPLTPADAEAAEAETGTEAEATAGAGPTAATAPAAEAAEDTERAEEMEGAEDTEGAEEAEAHLEAEPLGSELEREGDLAADYLEELLDIADLDGDIDLDVENDRAMVSIVGGDLSSLVGRDGEVLEALQELTRLAVTTGSGHRSRLMLDVAGFRAGRKAALAARAADVVEEVRRTGAPVPLEPMNPFERKVVHDAVAEAGLRSESEGVEPQRHVVVLPA